MSEPLQHSVQTLADSLVQLEHEIDSKAEIVEERTEAWEVAPNNGVVERDFKRYLLARYWPSCCDLACYGNTALQSQTRGQRKVACRRWRYVRASAVDVLVAIVWQNAKRPKRQPWRRGCWWYSRRARGKGCQCFGRRVVWVRQ